MNSVFCMRIVSVDSYITKPTVNLDVCYSDFKKREVTKVPVIRIFGSTPTGQTTCLNIHGVFPYLMVPYCGPDLSTSNEIVVQEYLVQMASSLDHALSAATSSVNKHLYEHVFKVVLLRATPFYGYYEKDELFMKIYFYYPTDIKRAADLLQAGAVMNRSYQPHEAHIPYILQMFLDYNLYGMNLLHSKSCWFRKPIGKFDEHVIIPKASKSANTPPTSNVAQPLPATNQQDSHSSTPTTKFCWNNLRKTEVSTSDSKTSHNSKPSSQKSYNSSPSHTPASGSHQQCDHSCLALLHRSISNATSASIFSSFDHDQQEDGLSSSCPLHTVWNNNSVPVEAYLPCEVAPKNTTCEIEVDVLAADILNRNELETTMGKNPGIASIWADEKARRRARNETSVIELPPCDKDRIVSITEKEKGALSVLREAMSEHFSTSESANATESRGNAFSPEESQKVCVMLETEQGEESGSSIKTSLDPVVNMEIVSQVFTPSQPKSQSKVKDTIPETDSFLLDLMEMDTVETEEEEEDRQVNSSSLASQRSNGLMEECSDTEEDLDYFLENEENATITKASEDESYILSQPWESGIEEMIADYTSDNDIDDNSDNDTNNTLLPQLDGKWDDRDDGTKSQMDSDTDNCEIPSSQERNYVVKKPKKRSLKVQKLPRKRIFERSDVESDLTNQRTSTPKQIKQTETSRIIDCSQNDSVVLKAVPSPPSAKDAEAFLKSTDGCLHCKKSEEPFYSKREDMQPFTSARLLETLPASTKPLKYRSVKEDLEEFSSAFPCGLHHWRVVLSTTIEFAGGSKHGGCFPADDSGSHQPPVTMFHPDQEVILKPALSPPDPGKIWRWVKRNRKRMKAGPSVDHEEEDNNDQATSSIRSLSDDINEKISRQESKTEDSSLHELENTPSSAQLRRFSRGSSASLFSSVKELEDARTMKDSLEIPNNQQHLTSTPVTRHSKRIGTLVPVVALKDIFDRNWPRVVLKDIFKSAEKTVKKLPEVAETVMSHPEQLDRFADGDKMSRSKSNDSYSSDFKFTLHSLNDPEPEVASGVVGHVNNTFAFRASQRDLGDSKALHEVQHITVLSMELHVKTRLELLPDPEVDEIRALFYAVHRDSSTLIETGTFIVDPQRCSSCKPHNLYDAGFTNLPTVYVSCEYDLLNHFTSFILKADPDVLLGYEVQMLSWGYLLARAAQLGYDLCPYISRAPFDPKNSWYSAERDAFGADNASEIHIVGRLVLNLWRLMRSEASLYDYKFESVAYHLLHQRHPHYSHRTLTLWFDQPISTLTHRFHQSHSRARVIDYYMCRVIGNLKLISQQDLIGRTSELARLFGIQFYEVLTRGTQFRVESMMLRLAHSLNFVAVSPGTMQRAGMKAPECIALVMEPESRFYAEPVIVVDFQSLYPSMIIAYNYCFSTCLGRVEHLKSFGATPFGCTSLNVPFKTLNDLLKKDAVTVAPNGVAYVKSSIRRGVMPAMLDEILSTRIMVKDSMKKCDDKATKQMLDYRQLGLKLIANVTYGYTSASFSGRMPCVEIADSIVRKARETLERAIELVHANWDRWQGRVVYGDTDSMFIALQKGTSKQRAFQIGREIIAEVTRSNPEPVKLRFEKIYQPCVLQTKKRYVGYAFETEDQKEPIFDAKGIETVRRDGCPAVAKILEKSLRILFDKRDVSQVKSYVENQCRKILDGKSTLQDCTIAKEYRGAKYYKAGVLVPALVLTRKLLAIDKRSEPRLGERVPYVVVHGAPGTPLYTLIRRPKDVLFDPNLRLNGNYYVLKMVLPALDRVMSLLGVDVFQWYQALSREMKLTNHAILDEQLLPERNSKTKKATLSQYFASRHCLSCNNISNSTICSQCLQSSAKRQECTVKLMTEIRYLERRHHNICVICCSCSGAVCERDIKCECMDCPVLHKRARTEQDVARSHGLRKVLASYELF